MSATRLAFLLALLALPASAAPAPLPRKEAANAGAWSDPIDGLRVRLVASRKTYRAGEPVLLTLEIQNVTEAALTVEEPCLMPVVAAPGGVITATGATTGPSPAAPRGGPTSGRSWRRSSGSAGCGPGQTLRINVTAAGELEKEGEEKLQKLEELEAKGEAPRQKLAFPAAQNAGTYELRATYLGRKDGGRGGAWNGAGLTSPPVKVERAE